MISIDVKQKIEKKKSGDMIIYTPEDLLMNFRHCTFFFSSSSLLYLCEAARTTIIIFLENKCF